MQCKKSLHPAAVFDSHFSLFNPPVIGVKKLLFHMPQFIGQVYMDGMGVYQTAGFIPQGVKLLFAVGLDIHNLRDS